MPPICWHVAVAQEALARLGNPGLDEDLGEYLLGSTAPDIRVITGRPREETHFFDIQKDHGATGIPRLFEAHPHLLRLTGRARAFVLGYLTHLIVDELWIDQVYRPFFGKGSGVEDRVRANVMDRVLQFHLDRAERLDRDRFKAFCDYVLQAEPGDQIRFIEPDVLHRWRAVVRNILSQEPTWEGFRSFAIRRFLGSQDVPEQEVRALFDALPDLLESTLEYVSRERVAAFKEDAVQGAAAAVREYCA